MTDIHCHILPDVDDGAEDLKESLAMAELAVRSGVRDIIATPHFRGRAGEKSCPVNGTRSSSFFISFFRHITFTCNS